MSPGQLFHIASGSRVNELTMNKKKLKGIPSAGTMKSNGDYEWRFSTFGGVTRVKISTGDDIAHLSELDQKLWTVLSCPASGLEMDPDTLAMLDLDGDGKIRVNEILSTVDWLKARLSDMETLISRSASLPLSAISRTTDEGKKTYACAKQILENLGLEKDSISLSDVSDSIAIFAKTRFNGDGIVTENSTDDASLKAVIRDCVATVGSLADRSGDPGVDADKVAAFYKAAADYVAWKDAGVAEMFPYGDRTEEALAACNSLKDKVSDFFMRCKLASFNSSSTAVLDVTAERIGAISDRDLSSCADEIAAYPLAKVNPDGQLPLKGINPAWKSVFDKFKSIAVDAEYPDAEYLTEQQWDCLVSKFDSFSAWRAAKAGAEVEPLGYDRMAEILKENRREEIDGLIAQDKALEAEVAEIQNVDRLLHLCRDFYTLLRNYVTFSDFYSREDTMSSIFQAGRLYIDQRNCDLCIKVTDMGKQGTMAGASGMYLLYCDCTSKKTAAKMTIVAVMTDGDVNNLRVGCNAIFYDRAGNDWDAVVTKIVDNPISVRQAFWSPYKKIGSFVEGQINKIAAKQDSKVMEKATADLTAAGSNVAAATASGTPQTASPAQPFDVAKFAGIFAMIGMALGSIGTFLASLYATFAELSVWGMIGSVAGIILIISGPSMIMSWMSLRKRNLAPILNANGWAVNANVIVNVRFGQTLTGVAKMPVFVGNDPFAEKKMPRWKKTVITVAVCLGIVLGILTAVYFRLPAESRPFWPKPQTEAVQTEPAASTMSPEIRILSFNVMPMFSGVMSASPSTALT